MLAYAFALHTPYTLLDEPTNGLDITSRQALKRIISRSTVSYTHLFTVPFTCACKAVKENRRMAIKLYFISVLYLKK